QKEDAYIAAGLDDAQPDEQPLLVHQPGLPDRPTVMANGHARIGRPPQQVPEILIAPAPL
ncbi:putative arsenate reductase (partial), partial [Erwinia amylovora ATCC 49946]